jgi:hypothetical protein
MRNVALAFNALVLGLALLGGRSSAQAPEVPPLAPLWTVHIDDVQPALTAEFERLNVAENRGLHEILRRHGQPIKPVYEIATAGARYLSFRPKASFTDFDTPSTVPDSVANLFSTVTDDLDGPIHATLAYHHNEVWRLLRSDSYFPSRPGYRSSTPGYIQLVSERVVPRLMSRYGALVDSLNIALATTDYPWGVMMFSSSYGDGSYHYFWQADSQEEFLAAGDRATVLARAFGQPAADRMLADWQRCLAGSETVDAAPRPDFTDLDPATVWPGLPSR